ncbi:outer membrane putative beta-barrel porin/alpha-amylase [Pseudoduganella flava]|uniref:Outer membrane putative beta-barrel porin/alpha-amylase n=1 Tax=Pseudoduganella flava TaxID=871742 RepID=A0A562PTK5_9BURK|nr:transporter [Pseudoduganella flava]QGZ39006.1 transporter [Pseudoduganella flava]TWI47728.1 outer membrane putative beta-barrel porin/alpha-amylase [Pseudoduganella flava]
MTTKEYLAGALLCCAALLPLTATAQQKDEDIATDRPDFVESSNVVGKGRVQIETGFALERNRDAGLKERTTTTPTLLRVGVSDTVELRLETDGRERYRADSIDGHERAHGWADDALGVKWHVRDAGQGWPSLGVLLHADIDSGSAAFRGEGVRPSLRVSAEWELPHGFDLGVMPGLIRERSPDGGHAVNGIFGIVLGKALTDRVRTFVELAAPRIARGRDGGTQATFDVGGSWVIARDWQVDALLARGVNSRTPDLAL